MSRTCSSLRYAGGGPTVTAVAADSRAEPNAFSALALAETLRDHSGREGGCVVVMATPNASPHTPALRALSAAGLTAVVVRHLSALTDAVAELRPDLVVLDVAICETAVHHVLADLGGDGAPGVILTGALPNAATRAALLCAGADDCLLYPYLLDEFVARVLAVLRRCQPALGRGQGAGYLIAGSMRVDLDQHLVEIDDQPVALTLIEFRLLAYLLRHRGVALSRRRLLADVWGYTIGTPETVTVHVRRLRTKIELDPSRPRWIETVWGVGYRFRAEPSPADPIQLDPASG